MVSSTPDLISGLGKLGIQWGISVLAEMRGPDIVVARKSLRDEGLIVAAQATYSEVAKTGRTGAGLDALALSLLLLSRP